jgi:hypothetical protein
MNWLQGREVMWFQHKWTWSVTLALFGLAKINEKEGDTLSDIITFGATAISITAIWQPEIRAMMVSGAIATAPAAVPIAAVAVSTYAIGGIIAFAAADPEDEGWYGAEALKEYYHDPLGTTTDIATELVVDPVARWLVRRAQDIAPIALLARKEFFKNRWVTGPVLPF